MKVKKIPLRRCVVTKESLPKESLLRVTRTKDMNVSVDLTGKAHGRGAYIKKSVVVIQQARKKNILSKVLEAEVPTTIYDELEALCHD